MLTPPPRLIVSLKVEGGNKQLKRTYQMKGRCHMSGRILGLVVVLAQSYSSGAFSSLQSLRLPAAVTTIVHRSHTDTSTGSSDNIGTGSGETTTNTRLIRTTPPASQRRLFSLNPLVSVTLKTPESSQLLVTFRTVAHWANVLCILDCTVLPLLAIILPLMGWIGTTSALQQSLCAWSHSLALYFVLPLGTTTTLLNYGTGHRNKGVAYLGIVGLLFIGIANGDIWEVLHHGPMHRVVNVVGCGMLWSSNYIGQKLGCDCGVPFCKPKKPLDPPPSAMMMQTRMIQYKNSKAMKR